MTFDQWKNRPVYKAQCVGFRRAKELCKIDPDANFATHGGHILSTFRALPGYRDKYAQALRDLVALSLKMDRLNKRLGK